MRMELDPTSRVWVYMANRPLTKKEVEFIQESGLNFIQNWAAHGTPLRAGVEVMHSIFLIIAADEKQAMASGCSIDKSVHWVKALGKELHVDFFNRLNVGIRDSNGMVNVHSINEIEALYQNNKITDESLVFNTVVNSLDELKTSFEIPLKESWLYSRVLV